MSYNRNGCFLLAAGVWCLVLAAALGCLRFSKEYAFARDVTGRLDRAAHAADVADAKAELDAALAAAEARGLTAGNTGVFLELPENDLGFWYKNLKAASAELGALPPAATPLERTNVLLKLRETLVGHAKSAGHARHPESAAVYPNVAGWVVAGWLMVIAGFAGVILTLFGLVGLDD